MTLGTGLARKSGHKDPLYFCWAPCPAPSGKNVELSELDLVSMAPGLQMSHNNPQAPALSWLYAHDAFHQKNPVGKAYLAPNPRQKKILSFLPFLFTLFNQHGLLWIHAVLKDIKKESAWPQFIVQFPLKFGEPQFPLLLIGILMASASLTHDRVVRIKGKCVQEFFADC